MSRSAKSNRRRRAFTGAPPPLAPTRSGRRGTPPAQPIRIKMPDGHEVVVSGHFFDTQRKAKRGLIKAWAEQVGLPPDLTYGELSHMFAEQVREDVAMIQITTYLLDRGVSWSRVLDWWSRPCVDMPDQTPRWLLVNYGPERAMVRARMDATALGAKRMEAA